jgi:hypothetical protein
MHINYYLYFNNTFIAVGDTMDAGTSFIVGYFRLKNKNFYSFKNLFIIDIIVVIIDIINANYFIWSISENEELEALVEQDIQAFFLSHLLNSLDCISCSMYFEFTFKIIIVEVHFIELFIAHLLRHIGKYWWEYDENHGLLVENLDHLDLLSISSFIVKIMANFINELDYFIHSLNCQD